MKYKLKTIPVFIYLTFSLILFSINFDTMNVDALHIVGASITLISFIFWIVARFQLGEAFSVMPKAKHLVTSGIYSKVRHPVYVFSSLALLGITIFFRNPFILCLFLGFLMVQIIRVRKEDKVLSESFGSKYKEYKKTTWL